MGRRGPRASAKNPGGACARTFGCRTMSGISSHGGRGLFSPRKPAMAIMARAARTKMRRKPRSMLFLVDNGDVLTACLFEQGLSFLLAETRIARFNGEEKAVVGHAGETVPVEHGMIPARETVHDLPGEKSGEGREQNGELEYDWEKGGNDTPGERLSMNDQWIKNP